MIACLNCRTIFSTQILNSGRLHKCEKCHTEFRVELFNAFHQPVDQSQVGEYVHVEGHAECFYHPRKMAKTACSSCGRLLCVLCEISLDGRTLCTNCLKSGGDKRQIESIEKGRILYDSIALHLSFWPLVLFPFVVFTIITAPIVIYIVLRHWRTSSSILPRSRFRFFLALFLAGVQLISWAALVVMVLS